MKEVIDNLNKIDMIDPFTQCYVSGITNMIADISQSNFAKMALHANAFRRKNMLTVILTAGLPSLSSDQAKQVSSFIKQANSDYDEGDDLRKVLGTKIVSDPKGMKTLIESLADSQAYDWMDQILGSNQDLIDMSLTDLCSKIASNLKNGTTPAELKKAYSTRLVLEVLGMVQFSDISNYQNDVLKVSSTAALQHRVSTISSAVDTRVRKDFEEGVISVNENKLNDLIRDRNVYHLINSDASNIDRLMTSSSKSFYKDAFDNNYIIDFVLDLLANVL